MTTNARTNAAVSRGFERSCQKNGTRVSIVPADTRALVAVDMGAESCRVSLLRWIDGRPQIRMLHRFANGPIAGPRGLVWDIEKIHAGIEAGLHRCAETAPEGISAIGVDSWAVDYVRLGSDGKPLGNPFCYRDQRNLKAEEEVHRRISKERLYELTGIQQLPFNTLNQLYADHMHGVDAAAPWVNFPEYVLHWLGGRRVAEYTNATHTQLVDLRQQTWCREIFDCVGLDISAAPPLVPPGTIVGTVRCALDMRPQFRNTRLIAPACHDTASAIAGIPAVGEDWAFLSSGTWSLVGTLLDQPCVTSEAQRKNYTNLGGAGSNICFLKNVNGMWLIRQCMEQWETEGAPWALSDLLAACESVPASDELLDVDDADLLLPGNMLMRINAQRARTGQPLLPMDSQHAPVVASLIFRSLAARYGEVLKDIAAITGKNLKRLFIVGGGSRNAFLNQLTAEATGLEVVRGCAESSTVGNFAVQIASLEGLYTSDRGVDQSAVAHWAGVLGAAYAEETATAAGR